MVSWLWSRATWARPLCDRHCQPPAAGAGRLELPRPQLQDLYEQLNAGRARSRVCVRRAPVHGAAARAYQWADGSAYLNHVELVRRARGAEVPASFGTDPLMYQGGSDDFLGPCDDVVVPSEAMGIDFEAEIAVITGDVKMGASPNRRWTACAC